MPKPMTMTIEVEEVAFGRVFRTLDGMPGVVAIKLPGHGPKPQAAVRAKTNGATSEQIVLGRLLQGPATMSELTVAMTNGGKREATLANALHLLRKKKLVAGGKGEAYKLTKAGQTAATKGE